MESLQIVNNDERHCNEEEELKVQEKINLKREARRRKILENAKTRLERLNGRAGATNSSNNTVFHAENHIHVVANGPKPFDSVDFSDPEVEPDIIPQQLLQNDVTSDISNLFNSLNADKTSLQQERHILVRARLHLIVSAMVSCILSFGLRESTTSSLSIFIPAGLCVIIDLLFFREQQSLNPVINLVITMCNIRLPYQTKIFLHLLSIIQSLIVDLGVFICSFCIFACSLSYINKESFDLIVIK